MLWSCPRATEFDSCAALPIKFHVTVLDKGSDHIAQAGRVFYERNAIYGEWGGEMAIYPLSISLVGSGRIPEMMSCLLMCENLG